MNRTGMRGIFGSSNRVVDSTNPKFFVVLKSWNGTKRFEFSTQEEAENKIKELRYSYPFLRHVDVKF